MCNKQRSRKMFFAAVAVCGFPYPMAHACSVWDMPGLSVPDPLPVVMIDGADRNSSVKLKVQVDSPKKSGFDFGFVNDGLYTPVTGKSHAWGSYTFTGGATVDFALRNGGPDHVLGTADDQVYRLSDGADYAQQYYFDSARSPRSRNPRIPSGDFRELRLDWDLNHDGKTDVETWIGVKRNQYDAMAPAAAPVPVPSTMWLFGSGLVVLATALRRRVGCQM